MNIPMEAWSVKGISAIESSVGKPIIMDEITTKMCLTEIGRIGFARVLVEIDADKEVKDIIEIMYKSKNVCEGTRKVCLKLVRKKDNVPKEVNNEEDFVVNNRYQQEQKKEYRRRNMTGKSANMGEKHVGTDSDCAGTNVKSDQGKVYHVASTSSNDGIVKEKNDNRKDNIRERRSHESTIGPSVLGSNNFTLLDSIVNAEDLVPNVEQRKIMDEFLNKNQNADEIVMNKWNDDMRRYYRDKKKLIDTVHEMESEENVFNEECSDGNNVLRNEVKGEKGTS
ncbi:hypothetical protein Tco_1303553 [Tanacetum coccineum]